jgi:hypothetical protein
MRLPGTPHECGPLLELGFVTRHLHLGAPITEGPATIPVRDIAGTVQRGHDFDACWRPLHPALAKRLDDIELGAGAGLDEPIEVVRVDRAYFVVDGHKRVALAHRSGREFIDAAVSRIPSPYALTSDIDEVALFRTAREDEFRRHSGLREALPDVRFVLSDMDGYGELYRAVQVHAFHLAERHGRVLPWTEVARSWYEMSFLPTVVKARASVGSLLDSSTDADIYLAIHRQALAWWGTECDAPECAAQQVLAERAITARRRSFLAALRRDGPAASVLPLTERGEV